MALSRLERRESVALEPKKNDSTFPFTRPENKKTNWMGNVWGGYEGENGRKSQVTGEIRRLGAWNWE